MNIEKFNHENSYRICNFNSLISNLENEIEFTNSDLLKVLKSYRIAFKNLHKLKT